MELKFFRTQWGNKSPLAEFVQETADLGYDGIEGPIPDTGTKRERLAQLLDNLDLEYIAEVATTGSYVPDRRRSSSEHLDCLTLNLQSLGPLRPLFITCLGGCDAWSIDTSSSFFSKAKAISGEFSLDISFETHRGRSLYSPWVSVQILDACPDIELTCDFSHWYVVCEGLEDHDETIIRLASQHARHIHARIGYAQGPQVPDPSSPVYSVELERHCRWWEFIWQHHRLAGRQFTTLTPEFGPDGYDYQDPHTGNNLIPPSSINNWMMEYLRDRYRAWQCSYPLISDIPEINR